MKNNLLLTVSVALVTSLITVGLLGDKDSPQKTVIQVADNAVPASQVLYSMDDDGRLAPLDFSATAERVTNAVVHIKSAVRSTQRGGGMNPFEELFGQSPYGDRFRQAPQQEGPMRMGSGSGVVISADGYIVTNNHVIDNADELEVVLNDNRSYNAEVIGTDPSTDLALIKIDAEDLPALTFGNSDGVKIGSWVMAVGNPYNLTSTVTAGIVSATGRSINILQDRYAIESFIQTDAAINPGNSGGALVNLDGQLVGINTAISSPTGSYSGYGFAVPANLVRKVIKDLKDYGTVQRGVLGVSIRNIDGALADELRLTSAEGVYVDALMDNSAAGEAGVQTKDVIIAVDGKSTTSTPKLQEAIANKRPGDRVALTVIRAGREKTLNVTLRNRSGNTQLVKAEEAGLAAELGASYAEIDAATAKEMGISGGVRINELRRGKLAQQTNMREGFVITHVNGKEVRTVKAFEKALQSRRGGNMVEGYYENSDTPYYYAFGL